MRESYAVIMAGGSCERFWPLSTPEKPKQFLDFFGGKPLIRHAVDRLEGLIPPDRIFVITVDRFVGMTREALPVLPVENIIGEPWRRDTAFQQGLSDAIEVAAQTDANEVGIVSVPSAERNAWRCVITDRYVRFAKRRSHILYGNGRARLMVKKKLLIMSAGIGRLPLARSGAEELIAIGGCPDDGTRCRAV